jgi:hypothetical protein
MPISCKAFTLSIYFLSFPLFAADIKNFGCSSESKSTIPSSPSAAALCLPEKKLALEYQRESGNVTVRVNGHPSKAERIGKKYSPDQIDMQGYIRFLPLDLQPYLSSDVVLFNSVTRSTSGNGSGQCGSGYELYLNAIRLGKTSGKIIGRTKIGSCVDSIFPTGMDEGPTDYSAFSIKDGRLSIKFFNYKSMDASPIALLSHDFRRLEFGRPTE